MKAFIQGKDNAIKNLRMQISQLKETRSEADRTLNFRALDFHITQLTEKVTALQEQNELFRVENEKIKQHYKELKNRKVHLDYLKHLKESVATLREIVEEARIERTLDRSLVSACLYTKHSQELLEYLIGVNSCADASGSQPRSNTKKNRILLAKRVNKKKIKAQPRTNKSSLKTMNHVIKFRDSYEAPKDVVNTASASDGTGKKKGRTVTLTTDDMQKRKNDVNARTTLLLVLPDEHQLRFSKHKTAQELWAAILKTFGGNEATKKTKKNLLKQKYGNFKAEGSETLEQTFNRLHVIVSHLEFIDIEIEQDDLNQKFLTSLAPEWLMHTIVWRNRTKHNSGNEEVNTTSVSTASTNVSTASVNIGAASISQDTTCAYIASQSNGSQIKFEDINQIDEDDMEEMDIKWNMALLSMRADRFWKKTGKRITIQGIDVAGFGRSKVECFNCHKMGHFARECRALRSQDKRKRDNYRQGSKVKEQTPKAFMAIDGVGWDWSYMANDEKNHALVFDEEAPTEFALMAKTSAESVVFDNSLCSKACKKNTDSLNSKITELTDKLSDSKNMIYHYKLGLSQVEARLAEHRNQEVKYYEKIRVLEFKAESRANCIKSLTKELELIKKEKEGLDSKLAGFQTDSKDLDSLLESNISYITDYEPFDRGYVSFGQGGCMITGKGTIKTCKLEFENVYFVKDLKVLLNKSHNETPYELFNGRTPAIGFLKPFGCHVMILNTLDHLGKFKAKGDKGFFIGYSMSSKSFRVFNKRTKRVEENLHVDFLKNKAIEKAAGPNGSPVPTACLNDSQEPSSDTRLISKRVANQVETPSLDNILTLTNRFEDILEVTTNSVDSDGVEADVSNMETSITASPTPTLRIHKDHSKSQIIGPVDTPIQTRNKSKEVEAMQEELLQFKIQNVWTLVNCPKGVRPIGTKWILKNKKDERGIVIRNKARLVAQGHTQEEGINYDEVFAPVARIEAIRLFLAYASFMGFTVYQMDVKSTFLYGTIDKEVYVMKPLRFQDSEFPAKVYKVEKAMYGLHQAPRAWYGTLSTYLLTNGFQRGDILKKFRYSNVRSSNTPMDNENPWGKDETGKDVDLHHYRSMIRSLMYLTASRPDIMFAVCACARHQVTPKECQLHAVKRIFKYLKGHPKLGLWYPKESSFDLVAYLDSDYDGASQDRKSTTGGCQFLGTRLISWQCKKQTIVATSTTKAEYVAAASGYG
nr:hypothetical protein [Tanacetum cinerariifolium]